MNINLVGRFIRAYAFATLVPLGIGLTIGGAIGQHHTVLTVGLALFGVGAGLTFADYLAFCKRRKRTSAQLEFFENEAKRLMEELGAAENVTDMMRIAGQLKAAAVRYNREAEECGNPNRIIVKQESMGGPFGSFTSDDN